MGTTNLHRTNVRDLNFILVRSARANPDRGVDLQIESGIEDWR